MDKGINDDYDNDEDDGDGNENNANGGENIDKMDTDSDTEKDFVMIGATLQKKPKLSLNEAEDKLKEVREYISASSAPADNIDFHLCCANNLRAHNASKARQQKTIIGFLLL